MESNGTKGKGNNLKIANPPNRNGNGAAWENFGNLFLDATGKRGTFYLDVTVEQLKALLATAADGRVKKKIGVFAKSSKDSAPTAAAPQAAA